MIFADLDPERVQLWWYWVTERQRIFRQRLEGRPRPWTDDPILHSARFVEVYREQDRVSLDVQARVLDASRGMPDEDRYFNLLVYRVFNLPATWTALGGGQPRSIAYWRKEWRRAEARLQSARSFGAKVFTGAYMINAAPGARGRDPRYACAGGKISLWIDRLRWSSTGRAWQNIWLQTMSSLLLTNFGSGEHVLDVRSVDGPLWRTANSGELQGKYNQMIDALCEIDGVAQFTAQEIVQDASYTTAPILGITGNWGVCLGPGAFKGLGELLPDIALHKSDALPLVRELRDHQERLVELTGRKLDGPPLTLWNVEDTLCEFSKYMRLRRGDRPKRRYVPNPDLRPWS